MTGLTRPIRRILGRRADASDPSAVPAPPAGAEPARPTDDSSIAVDIAESDPLLAYLQSASGPVEISRLELDSPAVRELRDAGVALIVPLVSQGELIGTLNLGPRLSEQEYSTDDRRLLTTLAAQAAPAVRVAQLVAQQAVEIQARERLEQEMRVAQLIQQQFLPRELPALADWQVAAYYGPARTVGGDFYDFIELPDGRIGIVVGDVADKGVPAALVMARTHSILRGDAARLVSPARVLERANELLVPEIPTNMFVTCLYAVLDTATGHLVFANAGHNLPSVRTSDGVIELRATGMPLGLLPDMTYDEHEAVLAPGETFTLYSDGIVEAHDPGGDMFGFPRLHRLLAEKLSGSELVDHVLSELHRFTGKGWEQEDDITLVTIRRSGGWEDLAGVGTDAGRTLLDLEIAGEPGNERMAMDRVAEAVAPLALPAERVERLKTAVSEAVMNAIEYGSGGRAEVPIRIEVRATEIDLVVTVTDAGVSGPMGEAEEPDLEAKLAGEQKPRGWGLFLIKHMVDAMEVTSDGAGQTVTLTMHLEGAA